MKHSHYHKDVSGLQSIDVYRVLRLFEVTDPCLQHAIKKLLVAGGRGAKAIAQDVQEAIDTLERWKQMRDEDQPKQGIPPFDPIRTGIFTQDPTFRVGDCIVCGQKGGHSGVQCPRLAPIGVAYNEERMDIIGQNGNDGLHYGQCLTCKRESCACP